jgi:hypothetical protein
VHFIGYRGKMRELTYDGTPDDAKAAIRRETWNQALPTLGSRYWKRK